MLECAATGNWYTWSKPTEKTMRTKTASRLVTRPSVDEDNFEASYKADCVKEREVALNSLKQKRNSDDGVWDPVVEVPNDLDLMEEV